MLRREGHGAALCIKCRGHKLLVIGSIAADTVRFAFRRRERNSHIGEAAIKVHSLAAGGQGDLIELGGLIGILTRVFGHILHRKGNLVGRGGDGGGGRIVKGQTPVRVGVGDGEGRDPGQGLDGVRREGHSVACSCDGVYGGVAVFVHFAAGVACDGTVVIHRQGNGFQGEVAFVVRRRRHLHPGRVVHGEGADVFHFGLDGALRSLELAAVHSDGGIGEFFCGVCHNCYGIRTALQL